MKTHFSLPMVLTGAAAAMLLTGCAAMNPGYPSAATAGTGLPPGSAMSWAPVTDPNELVKWSGSAFENNLRSVDVYRFVVPETGYLAEGEVTPSGEQAMAPEYRESAGAPGPYEQASGGYTVIRHVPNQR